MDRLRLAVLLAFAAAAAPRCSRSSSPTTGSSADGPFAADAAVSDVPTAPPDRDAAVTGDEAGRLDGARDTASPPDRAPVTDGFVVPVDPFGRLPRCRLVAPRSGMPCAGEMLPCWAIPDPFNCLPVVCVCEGGLTRCEPTRPGIFGGNRACLGDWFCSAEGLPICNYDKPWTLCRCSSNGGWVCADECKARGCPTGPVPALTQRPHTGDACTATLPCPYRGFTCTCVGGRFECSDEPVRDGGTGADWPGCAPAPDLSRAPYSPGAVAGCPPECPASCISCPADGGASLRRCAGACGNPTSRVSCDGPEDCPVGQVCVHYRSSFEFGQTASDCRAPAQETMATVPGDVPRRQCHTDADCRCSDRCGAAGCIPR
jgi:hypothetical protein